MQIAGQQDCDRRDGGWGAGQHFNMNRRWTQIEGCRSRFHRKERKVRKDVVTLTLRPLWCSISLIVYFNSHAYLRQQSPTPEATTRTHHFPTHALRMSTHTRPAAPGMDGRSSGGWGLDCILIKATESTEITEKCKNALCTRCSLWLKITLII